MDSRESNKKTASQQDTIPPAPPLPPFNNLHKSNTAVKPAINLKVTSDPPTWIRASQVIEAEPPPIGSYFFYGTLQSPSLLREILQLPSTPDLHPAQLTNASYELKLWGQYPALVKLPLSDSAGSERPAISGSLYEISSEQHAQRLQEYETKAYKVEKCTIRVAPLDGDEKVVEGWTFVYSGDARDLSDGVFDLGIWLRRMRRT
ncbi:hypothetical protein CB0940_00194 [Cercospora beticola]|uniref:Putative gamma-glutamylcyclotransferase n=1 Tax=Cercospora beticola TaxID=122368 RepID=A0A2G5ICW6_CERBT|nr:hypothetical protein CB0940_00194 [Cercospora beticola]PIB02621.1 hypothetical protein CB0940_00194 [Cercospora beticola]WPA95597.1 hypothetical protein RHO25_000199 [Cercospora beticola]